MSASLPDRLQRTAETRGEEVLYRFANGLTIATEVFLKADTLRILPLGSPQGSLMNHLLCFPDSVAGRRVLEPFAGSGALGFMALAAGAAHVDFVDVNPRAADFQRRNAALNHVPPERFTPLTADVADFVPPVKYDLLLANPPFVPTPDGIEGTLTSNGGPEGSRFAEIVIERLDELLADGGRALVYVFQLSKEGRPLIAERLAARLPHRPVEITPAQTTPIPLATYVDAYRRVFPGDADAIGRWSGALSRRHGSGVTLCHYVIDIGAHAPGPAECVVRENFAEKFGAAFFVPSEKPEELAFGRILENVVPGR